MEWMCLATPDGWVRLGWTHRGLAQVQLPPLDPEKPAQFNGSPPSVSSISIPPDWQKAAREELLQLLAGKPVPQSRVPLDLPDRSPFWRKVWLALREIPHGQVLSYKELARKIGAPKAVRAIGQACAANPIPLWIPCHRVIRSDGTLGGYSQGLEWKIRLLQREGILTSGNSPR